MRAFAATASAAGLRILPEIPDIELCRIEGKNGIGKSLLGRLLELVSGLQPYAVLPHAWATLSEGLGTVVIEIDELRSGASIRCELDGAMWRGRDPRSCAENPGIVHVNGEESTWQEARRHFTVRRIAGDEGLQETLGQSLYERALEAYAEADLAAERISTWSAPLLEVRRVIGDINADVLSERWVALEEATKLRQRTNEALKLARDRRSIAEAAASTAHRLQILGAQEDSALAEYRAHFEHHAQLRKELNAVGAQLVQEGSSKAADLQNRRKARDWARRLDLRYRAEARAKNDLEHAWKLAGAEGQVQPDAIPELVNKRRQSLEDINDKIQSGFLAGSVRTLVANIRQPLERLPSELLEQTVAEFDRDVSGAELREALHRRHQALLDVPKPERIVELENRKKEAQLQLDAALRIQSLHETAARKSELIREAKTQLELARAALPFDQTSTDVQEKVATLQAELVTTAVQATQTFARLKSLVELGPDQPLEAEQTDEEAEDAVVAAEFESLEVPSIPTIDEVSSQLALDAERLRDSIRQALHQLGFDYDPGNLAAVVNRVNTEAEKELVEASLEATQAIHKEELALAAFENARSSLRLAIEQVSPNSPLAEWRATLAHFAIKRGVDLDSLEDTITSLPVGGNLANAERDVAAVFGDISRALNTVEISAAEIRDAWALVASYLESAALRLAPRLESRDGISSRPTDFSFRQKDHQLQSWAEAELSTILSSPALVTELFDDASDVEVDLSDFAIQWRDRSGRRRRRALEAFSSGEQVFAYTRAKLEQLESLKGFEGDVLLILDEFGAFVARDRFSQLMEYVTAEALGSLATQVVVMLPLSRTVTAVSSEPEDGSQSALAKHLTEHGYFAISEAAPK